MVSIRSRCVLCYRMRGIVSEQAGALGFIPFMLQWIASVSLTHCSFRHSNLAKAVMLYCEARAILSTRGVLSPFECNLRSFSKWIQHSRAWKPVFASANPQCGRLEIAASIHTRREFPTSPIFEDMGFPQMHMQHFGNYVHRCSGPTASFQPHLYAKKLPLR